MAKKVKRIYMGNFTKTILFCFMLILMDFVVFGIKFISICGSVVIGSVLMVRHQFLGAVGWYLLSGAIWLIYAISSMNQDER